jgi:hypothetical protein
MSASKAKRMYYWKMWQVRWQEGVGHARTKAGPDPFRISAVILRTVLSEQKESDFGRSFFWGGL